VNKKIGYPLLGAVVAFPLSTLYLGERAKAQSADFGADIVAAVPYLSVTGSEYKRGFFTSTQTTKLKLDIVKDEPGELVVENVIQHGPLPGFSSIGAARITHNIIWPPAAAQEIAKVWGDRAPVSAVTTMNLLGGGTTRVRSPEFKSNIGGTPVNFQGAEATVNFTSGYEKLDYTLSAPGLSVQAGAKDGFEFEKITASGSAAKLAGTKRTYVGTQNANIASLQATGASAPLFAMKQIVYTSETSSPEPNFVSGSGKFVGNDFRVGKNDLGKMEYAFSMEKLHAPSLEALLKSFESAMKADATKTKTNAGSPAETAEKLSEQSNVALLNALKQHAPELSKHQPIFKLDKFRMGTDKDFLLITGSAKVLPLTAAQIEEPAQMLSKVDGGLNMEVSDGFLEMIANGVAGAMSGQQAGQGGPGNQLAGQAQIEASQAKQMVAAQIEGAAQAGYVVKAPGKVTTQISLKGGQVLVNGKPIGPPPGAQ
jgi:uncharacterized protein YdgA (DUF945 family)